MSVLSMLLVLAGLGCLLAGAASLSQATAGVGGLCAACFMGILARMAQASAHHGELLALAPKEAIAASTIQCAKCGRVGTRGPATCEHCGTAYAS